MPRIILQVRVIILLLFISACSVPIEEKKPGGAAPVSGGPTPTPTPTPVPTPAVGSGMFLIDTVQGELVISASGHKFRGAFEEISETQTTATGHIFRGVFYE